MPPQSARQPAGAVTADYNVIGVRPSSGAASTGCSDASNSIGGHARVPTLLPPKTGALRRGDPPPSLTQYAAAGWGSDARLVFGRRRSEQRSNHPQNRLLSGGFPQG